MIRRFALITLCGAAALATAACTPSAVAQDSETLAAAIAKDVDDVAAFKNAPSAAAGDVLAQDGSALTADIAQLKADLGSAPAPAKVAAALDKASKLALELQKPTAAGSAKLLADAEALERTAKAIDPTV